MEFNLVTMFRVVMIMPSGRTVSRDFRSRNVMRCDNSPVYKPYYCLIHPLQDKFASFHAPPEQAWIHVFSNKPLPEEVKTIVPKNPNLVHYPEIVYDFDDRRFLGGDFIDDGNSNPLPVKEIHAFAEECANRNPGDLVASTYLAYLGRSVG